MKSFFKLELAEARLMVAGALARSQAIGVCESICVVDEGGFPLALERMDGGATWDFPSLRNLVDQTAINAGIRLMGGRIEKRYRIYEKAL